MEHYVWICCHGTMRRDVHTLISWIMTNHYLYYSEPLSSEEEEEIREHRIKCLNNLAAAQLKLHHYDDVINSCNAVLEMDTDNAKALYRKGKVMSPFFPHD